MLVSSFMIPGCIMNGVGFEAQACAFLCFRACDRIVCSSGVCLLPFFALAINRVSLNSGLSMEHVCCHMFPPACVFPSGLGNIPVTGIGGVTLPPWRSDPVRYCISYFKDICYCIYLYFKYYIYIYLHILLNG